MAEILDFLHAYPTIAVALALAAVGALVVHVVLRPPVIPEADPSAWEAEYAQLAAELGRWAEDLRMLAVSLRLKRWSDAKYALRWRTLDTPPTLVDALDWDATSAQPHIPHALSRVIAHAEDLMATAVMVEGRPLLQGGGKPTCDTVVYASGDYAIALSALADEVEQARSSLANANHPPLVPKPAL